MLRLLPVCMKRVFIQKLTLWLWTQVAAKYLYCCRKIHLKTVFSCIFPKNFEPCNYEEKRKDGTFDEETVSDFVLCPELLQFLQHLFVAFSISSTGCYYAVDEAVQFCSCFFNFVHSCCDWPANHFHSFHVLRRSH